MAAYESFAQVYDRFMDNVPYDDWAGYIRKILMDHGILSGLVLDLGCGTGQMTRRFRDAGYDMIGVDRSWEMLQEALEAEEERSPLNLSGPEGRILYLQQDMRAFELYGTVRGVYSCCDCMNYILSEEDLLTVFRLVENYLDPGGVFVFDMNTEYYYRTQLGQNTFADIRDECGIVWENDYDPDTREHEYDLTIFTRAENGLYRRTQESHVEKAYPPGRVRELAAQAGLISESVTDGYSDRPLEERSFRMVFVMKRSGRKLAGQKTEV